MSYQEIKSKYIWTLMISIFLCAGLLMFGSYWIPERFTQQALLENPIFYRGIHESLMDIEEKIQKGQFELQDNIPFRSRSEVNEVMVIKMAEGNKGLSYTKYKIEIRFRYPYSVISRSSKLDAILVDVNPQQNHDFADLFWSLE